MLYSILLGVRYQDADVLGEGDVLVDRLEVLVLRKLLLKPQKTCTIIKVEAVTGSVKAPLGH